MRRAIGAFATLALLTGCTSTAADRPPTPTPSPSTAGTTAAPTPTSRSASTHARSTSSTAIAHHVRVRESPTPTHSTPPAPPQPRKLPLDYSTGNAGQVITVVAASHRSTTGTLQAWQRSTGQWKPVGPAAHAWLGTDGIGQASEQTTTTPQGSFPMTEAFGRYADPGTALPYRQTTPADWWISQRGPLYNTEQHCSSNCRFTRGEPNEHLYYAMPYYEYAVVVDYNRSPVHQGAGSAFFLHVTVGEPTQGCVSIDRAQLVRIMRWLDPAKHPRILMGVG